MVEPLIDLLKDKDSFVSYIATKSLREVLAKNPDNFVKNTIRKALGESIQKDDIQQYESKADKAEDNKQHDSSSAIDYEIPDSIRDRYTFIKQLGRGGFGDVFLVEDKKLGRKVAIKALHEEHFSQSQVLQRFENEGKIIAKLNHPNIISIYDLIGQRFIIMEFMDKGSVRELLKIYKRLEFENAAKIIIAILSALQLVHENNIIHRDIKPENLLLNDSGVPKLTDFGIAHLPDSSMKTVQTTHHIHHPGTLVYMSPEQIQGKSLDGRSDIYSVGVIFHEMLSGEFYIDTECQESPIAIAMAIREKEPKPLGSILGGIPKKTDDIIKQMMHKDRTKRFPSAEQAKQAINALLK